MSQRHSKDITAAIDKMMTEPLDDEYAYNTAPLPNGLDSEVDPALSGANRIPSVPEAQPLTPAPQPRRPARGSSSNMASPAPRDHHPDESQAAQPRRRRSEQTAAPAGNRRRSGEQSQSVEVVGPSFTLRVIAGMIGALGLVAATVGYSFGDIYYFWEQAVADATYPVWQAYAVMGGVFVVAAVVLGMLTALQDRSLWRGLWLGVGWAAIALVGFGFAMQGRKGPAPVADSNIQTGVSMAVVAALPMQSIIDRERSDSASALGTVQADLDETAMDLSAVRLDLAAEREKTVRLEQQMIEAEHSATQLRDQITALERRVGEVSGELTAARDQLTERQRQLATIETEAAAWRDEQATATQAQEALNERVRQLEAGLAEAQSRTQAAIRAQQQAQQEVQTLRALQRE